MISAVVWEKGVPKKQTKVPRLHESIQGSAKEWAIGYVKRASAARGDQGTGIGGVTDGRWLMVEMFYMAYGRNNFKKFKFDRW